MPDGKLARAARPVSLLLLLAYPLTVHAGVLTGVMWPALAVLAALVLLPPAMVSPKPVTLLTVLSVFLFGVLLLMMAPEAMLKLLYAPPVMIPLLLLWVFGRSLLPGRQPLVSRIALLMHDAPSEPLLRYTRGVTVAWTVFLAVLLFEVIAVGLYAGRETWSLVTNFYNYLLMALFFLAEFFARRFFIAAEERLSMWEFFTRLIRIDHRRLFR